MDTDDTKPNVDTNDAKPNVDTNDAKPDTDTDDARSNADESTLPGKPTSVWLDTTPTTDFGSLDREVSVDAAVVGGGIVGLTTAVELAEAGQTVAVIERDRLISGVTGRTTAKVTSQHGLVYDSIASSFGRGKARQYAAANQAAVERVADRVEEWEIDCAFRRLPAYVYTESDDEAETYREEARVARGLGLPAEYVEDLPRFGAAAGVRFDRQAQFHPREYLLALVQRLEEHGAHVFEGTRATDVDGGSPCRVETDRTGLDVVADAVVVATHFPMLDRAGYFARTYPKRSYVLAVRASDPPTEGMYYRPGTPYFSVRTHDTGDEVLTLVGGQNHKTGQGGNTAERYRRLERIARERFDVRSVEYRWSTQDYTSVDKVPYVGEVGPLAGNVYAATGFGGWGMSNGTAAGLMLSDAVLGESNPWADVFDPERLSIRASGKKLLSENVDAASRFVEDWATKPRKQDVRELRRDEATVTRSGTDVIGAYRDEEGRTDAVSVVCPHMGCLLEWNDAERTWDCPCHGSRFERDGSVIDGPAVSDLPTRNLDADHR
ncbi:FAD-dependent oxidoreductase [Halegenticoccus tardaugens]|uniref:FAD-dependent oxidoreductase n=1 Tax=Halegenticoccus tardaugens TaxID=2071624 RepID=UPI00100BB4A3|nr:FAD-dependent oxidoreductase [Halegenticoccus tardaugens]